MPYVWVAGRAVTWGDDGRAPDVPDVPGAVRGAGADGCDELDTLRGLSAGRAGAEAGAAGGVPVLLTLLAGTPCCGAVVAALSVFCSGVAGLALALAVLRGACLLPVAVDVACSCVSGDSVGLFMKKTPFYLVI